MLGDPARTAPRYRSLETLLETDGVADFNPSPLFFSFSLSLSLSSAPFPLSRRTPSVALFDPLESCERVIIEDDASIGAISSHLCRLSNRYAITSRRRFKLVKVAAG